jgi:hypothetical protein
VGLTIWKVKELEDYGYDKLYKDHSSGWLSDAKDAYDYVKRVISKGEEPRADDIVPFLLPAIQIDKRLHEHEIKNGPHEKEQRLQLREYFAEYIIEKYLKSPK